MRIKLSARSGLLLLVTLLPVTWAAHASEVYPDAASARPLQVGASVPSAQVASVDGTRVDLAELTRESGALLVFYRGGW